MFKKFNTIMKKSLKTFETAVINARFQPGLYQIAYVAFFNGSKLHTSTYELYRSCAAIYTIAYI